MSANFQLSAAWLQTAANLRAVSKGQTWKAWEELSSIFESMEK